MAGAGWQSVRPLELKARGADLVAAQFVKNPEPLLGPRARIYKDGSIVMQVSTIVGIDVSKNTLDYTWLPDGKAKQVANSTTGIASLIKKLQKIRPDLAVLEATGGYQTNLVTAMHEAGLALKVVNPRQVRDFARSLNRLGKTDALDARTLAEFGASRILVPDIPKDPKLENLSSVLRRREQIQYMVSIERSHLEHMSEQYKSKHGRIIKVLKEELLVADKVIKQLLECTPEFAEKNTILQSIPGIGFVTSATIIAELPELTDVGRKQASALVGLAPFNRDSGKYRGQRHISGGRARIRKVLYCALLPCRQYNPIVKEWFERFYTQRGKPYKVAMVACMRKLLSVMRAMLINKTQWESKSHVFS